MDQNFSVEIFYENCDEAHSQILVPKACTLENLKEKIEKSIRQVDVALYFHQGVEIEFDDETRLNQVFSSEIEVIQIDVFSSRAAVITIKSKKNIDILEKNGKIKSLKADIPDETDLKPISGTSAQVGFHKVTRGLFESDWPAKLRVVFPDQNGAVAILVRHYEIKEKCSYIEIRDSGDIFCQGTKNEFTIPARNGLVMEFKYKKNGEKKYKEVKDSQFLPNSPTNATEFWAMEKTVVQNALLCCKAAYHERPETYMASIENRRWKYKCISLRDPKISQKCVLALCEDQDSKKTMYIAFKGSGELDDWMVNADLTPYRFETLKRAQVHSGFYKRAKLWADPEGEIMEVMNEWDPKRIITTGHSLGAAISSIVHILLVRGSHAEPMKSLEYQNIGFATPLFGNLDLKKAIVSLSHSDARLKNMYHFVNCDDIVPAVSIIEETYANLTYAVGTLANNPKWVLKLFRKLGWVDMDETQEAELLAEIKNVLAELKKRKKLVNQPLLQDRENDTYMPIGHYMFMKNKGSGQSDLHVFEFEESVEKSEHQWIGQILIKSLGNLGTVTVVPPKYDHILAAHGLDNYFVQVANCLTSGVHDNLMQWKLATDVENSQEIQLKLETELKKSQEIQLKLVADLKKVPEKINSPPQKKQKLEES